MADVFPDKDKDFALWLLSFATELPNHAGALDVTPAEEADVAADSTRFAGELQTIESDRNALQSSVATKDDDREDTIEPRIRPLIRRMSAHPNMTSAIRTALGLKDLDTTPTPLGPESLADAGAPQLDVDISQRKRAKLHWGPNPLNEANNARPPGIKGVRLWYWLGSGEPPNESDWIFLDDDNRSPYTHVTMNSTPLTITFRAAYVDRLNRVGATSAPVTVTINP